MRHLWGSILLRAEAARLRAPRRVLVDQRLAILMSPAGRVDWAHEAILDIEPGRVRPRLVFYVDRLN